MSSDFLSRPVEVSKYGLIYAGAQKNAGPAGVTVVIIKQDLLERVPDGLPVMLDYKAQVAGGSMHNTPPCFAIYMVGLMLKWLKAAGGLEGIARRNQQKAGLIYQVSDASGGFYRGHAVKEDRSVMNVTLRLPNEELEDLFFKRAEAQGMVGLKGHRSVGGLRVSLYNAVTVGSAQILAQFMGEFQRRNG
jgi:phosphoserine aminotransferase